jgi:hypothetical protein
MQFSKPNLMDAELSTAKVYGRTLAGIKVRIPPGGMDICLLCLLCVVW